MKRLLTARFPFLWGAVSIFVMATVVLPLPTAGGAEKKASVRARALSILRETGVAGGLVVHLGCGEGRLSGALAASPGFLVHGLDPGSRNVTEAREHLRQMGVYGRASVERLRGKRLPYTDNLVNLIVVENTCDIPAEEMRRVLAPGGVVYVRTGETWKKTVKPWPEEIDDWGHFLHNPSNNAVSGDLIVGPPHHLQWVSGPRYLRSHEHLAGVSAVVTSGGRIFSIVDRAPTASVAFPAEWYLEARDAFNGVLLWERSIDAWEGYLRGFRSGPPELPRRMVASGNRLYVTLGYGAPVSVLDGACGKVLQTFTETEGALEILCEQDVLYVVTGNVNVQKESGVCPGTSGEFAPHRLLAVNALSGKLIWEKEDGETRQIMPVTLAVSAGRVFFHGLDNLVCLDARSGEEQWKVKRPVERVRRGWSTPTLVVNGGRVFSVIIRTDEDGNVESPLTPRKIVPTDRHSERIKWIKQSKHWFIRRTELAVFSAETGEELWRRDHFVDSHSKRTIALREGFNSPTDVFVIDGRVSVGLGHHHVMDPTTGRIIAERPRSASVGMGHHRCHRQKATQRFILKSGAGVEFMDVKGGGTVLNNWVRGTCSYGVMPANGLLYAPPHPCACYISAKLNGFNALAPKRETGAVVPAGERLEKGEAFGTPVSARATAPDRQTWPTYRRDPARSGYLPVDMPEALTEGWKVDVGGKLSSLVAAEGMLLVAAVDRHTVHALDAVSGRSLWRYTAGGRVDSPPTLAQGLAIFGSSDGYVYCLRASDGALVWRYRVGPEDRRIVAYGQLESAWPVHGSVLVLDDAVYCCAGRSSYVDGGIYLAKLDLKTGRELATACVNSRDPETGVQSEDAVSGQLFKIGDMPDILVGNDSSVFMRHARFSHDLKREEADAPRMYAATGFLDDSWWHRTMWLPWGRLKGGCFGWAWTGSWLASGRILAIDEERVYGFGRTGYNAYSGSHYALSNDAYRLFAVENKMNPEVVDIGSGRKKAPKGQRPPSAHVWQKEMPILVRGMVLTKGKLFISGPPEVLNNKGKWRRPRLPLSDEQQSTLAEQSAAWKGHKGGLLLAVSTSNGAELSTLELTSPPVFDGMIAAGGRLYVASMDGHVVCFAGPGPRQD